MIFNRKKDTKYSYVEEGEGKPILLLHGLMGGLSNFDKTVEFLSSHNYKVYSLELPLHSLPILKTNILGLTNFVVNFIKDIIKHPVTIVGNSLGGHITLMITTRQPEMVTAFVLTGSSGLYEKGFGESYPKRGSYDYVKRKTEEVFYDPKVATKELVDEVFLTLSDRMKTLKTLYIARSAIKHNMAEDIKKIKQPCCLIWGKQDNVTPPEVAEEFNELIPDSTLYWIDKCGHSPMMEKPDEFNDSLYNWLKIKGI